jgi:DNA-binding NarL/FixJ family response regulator
MAGLPKNLMTRRGGLDHLTPREIQIVSLLCRDVGDERLFRAPMSVWEIAGELDVSEAAIKQHLIHIYRKLDIPEGPDRRLRLANVAIEFGYLMTPEHRAACRLLAREYDGRFRQLLTHVITRVRNGQAG